ncbi:MULTISPECIES: ABC transporter permease [Corynebacterium]|uniref:ABC transporter permease n=1 Tax=Corynebacterium TaxID=1716 RepID=UPI00257A2AE7|nr:MULTISPECIES: ABC transporter permease [Corynebacterium]
MLSSENAALKLQLSVFVTLMIVWWAVTASGLIKPVFVPGPGAVWQAFIDSNTCRPGPEGTNRVVCGQQNYFLWQHLLASLQRIAIGVGAGAVFGIALGLVAGSSTLVRIAVEPYVNFLRALPPLGYIGLLIVWFGVGDVSKVWLLFIASFPPIAISTISGVLGVQGDKVLAARTLGASRIQVLQTVVFPAVLPEILTGLRLAIGLAWAAVVAAELNNGIPGIGGLAYISVQQLQTPLTVVCIIVIGLTAVLLDVIVSRATRLFVPWHGKS